MICSICGGTIEVLYGGWDKGNNAQPVNEGRCCNVCNDLVVLPRRIRDSYAARPVRSASTEELSR